MSGIPAAWTLLCCSALLGAGAEPRIFYSKYFKGSRPEYVAVTVSRSGQASYAEARSDDNPLRFQLAASDTQQMFDLAEKLGRFKGTLESGLKVAQMGVKTFRYEDGAGASEAVFNYSDNPDARALAEWFERIAETEQRFIELDRGIHFEKLGVNMTLLEIQVAWDRKRLMAPVQFLPLLDRISKNETFLHIARARAASLAEAIQGQPK
jgi:hypothetical protein